MTLQSALNKCPSVFQACRYLVIHVEVDNSYDVPLWAVTLQHYGFKRPFSKAHYSTFEAIIEDVKSISGFDLMSWYY